MTDLSWKLVHLVREYLTHANWAMSSWWPQMSWCQIGTRPSAAAMLIGLWFLLSLKSYCTTCIFRYRCKRIEADTRWPPARHLGRHIQVHFLEQKFLNFAWNFTEICYLGSNWQYGSIGLVMAWCRRGDKPLSEAMLICCTDTYMHHSASMI